MTTVTSFSALVDDLVARVLADVKAGTVKADSPMWIIASTVMHSLEQRYPAPGPRYNAVWLALHTICAREDSGVAAPVAAALKYCFEHADNNMLRDMVTAAFAATRVKSNAWCAWVAGGCITLLTGLALLTHFFPSALEGEL
jgi:hypothetical protein